jgi:thiol reductant ABC exporter CydC subunit
MTDLAPVGRTFAIARHRLGRLSLATLLGIATVGAGIGLLATSGWLISRASQQPSIAALGISVVAVRFFAITRGLFRYGERLVGHDAAFRSLADQRVTVYESLERIAPAGLPIFHRGDLLSRLVNDVDALQDLMIRVIPAFAVALATGVMTVLLVGWASPGSAVVLALTLGLAATAVPWLTQRLARRSEARQAEARAELTASVVDLVEGIPDLLANGATSAQLQRVEQADAELTSIAASSASTAGVGIGLVTLLTGLAMWGAAVIGVDAVSAGDLNATLLAVLVLVPLAAFELVLPLPAATQALEQVRRSAARLFEVIDTPQPVVEPVEASAVPVAPHHVVLQGVQARYGDSREPALIGVDLELTAGRRVAVVGASGAGKSTLANVLLRFLPYESGTITINGVELGELAGDDVRRVVGLAEQDPHLFATTLRKNLEVARPGATEAEMRDALTRARLGEFIAGLPAGLDTPVGERGTQLSGGQRQRVALARVLLADFPILVLDEPGEHLDTDTADALTADLLAATTGRTTLFITHRLVGLEALDEVVVLDHGRIVERGTQAELLAANGRFAQSWRRQQVGTVSPAP